jgi:glycosyltransferase involved in cell wall biosynthesis
MRILHLSDVYRPRVGGIEVFVEDLARRQRLAGHDVSVLTSTRGPEPSVDDVPVLRAPWLTPAVGDLPTGLRMILEGRYDVVHAHLSVVSPFATALGRSAARHQVPLVNTVHSLWAGREGWVRLTGALAGWKDGHATWTAVSEVAAGEMKRVLTPGTEVLVVPNAVDTEWWRSRTSYDEPRPVTIVSVMRLAGRKRPLALLEMLRQVRDMVPADQPLRAVIVGDGPQERRVRAAIERLDLGDWVELTGRLTRQEIRDLYGRTDLYVAPARQESFGIAALEARAAGVPVVALRSGGVGEFITDGVEGALCADDRQMALAIARLCTEKPLLAHLQAHNAVTPPRSTWTATLAGFDASYAHARGEDVFPVTSPAAVERGTPLDDEVGEATAGTILRSEFVPRRASADR